MRRLAIWLRGNARNEKVYHILLRGLCGELWRTLLSEQSVVKLADNSVEQNVVVRFGRSARVIRWSLGFVFGIVFEYVVVDKSVSRGEANPSSPRDFMFDIEEFKVQSLLYKHGLWLLIEDVTGRANSLLDVYLETRDREVLAKVVELLAFAEYLSKAPMLEGERDADTRESIEQTLAATRVFVSIETGSLTPGIIPLGWDVVEN